MAWPPWLMLPSTLLPFRQHLGKFASMNNRGQLPGDQHGAAGFRMHDKLTLDMIKLDWLAWIDKLGKAMLCYFSYACPFIHVGFNIEGGMFSVEESSGHGILIDLSADRPGIFDPNFGLFPLSYTKDFPQQVAWLMAVLLYHYNAQSVEFTPFVLL